MAPAGERNSENRLHGNIANRTETSILDLPLELGLRFQLARN
jgi:hypothetical protein